MKLFTKKNILIVLLVTSFSVKIKAQENRNSYQLIWSDEFNIEGNIDSTKWKFESGFVRNMEAQWYQKENAICKDGNLLITGKKQKKQNPNYIAGSANWKTNREFIDYTSASIRMKKELAVNTTQTDPLPPFYIDPLKNLLSFI